jgi:hypothetical protein
VYKVLTDKHA